ATSCAPAPTNWGCPLRSRFAWLRLSPRSRATVERLSGPAVLIIAAVVRLWRLDYHSIWFDEAVSLRWARADLGYTWRVTFQLVEGKHPPASYALLHLWRHALAWVGLADSDAALRVLGALLGVLTVWGVLRLATAVSGPLIGRVTAQLVALSPVLVWYSQEL